MLLSAVVTTYVASVIPWALSQPAKDANRATFLALSAFIAGRSALDQGLAERLYDALVSLDPSFNGRVRSLLALIEQHSIDPASLQATLDREHSPLAQLPRVIANAWFLGIVGAGDKARCVAYEDALNAEIVSDVLKPPTYCYGPYGSWSSKPT